MKVKDTSKKCSSYNRYCLQCHSIIEQKARGTTVANDIRAEEKKASQVVQTSLPVSQKEPKRPNFKNSINRKKLSSFIDNPIPYEEFKVNYKNPMSTYLIETQYYSNANVTFFSVSGLEDRKKYSMKRILPKDNEESTLILQEVSLHLTSANSNILKYYEAYLYENYIWIILEDCRTSLNFLIMSQAGFIPEKHMSYICKEVLKGLEYLHSSGRIHRDIKSRNVILFDNGEVKLGDFGYSAQVNEEDSISNYNPSWMAPELISGKQYNESVDVWALGILLLELAEGVPPYEGEAYDAVMEKILNNPPPRLQNKFKWSKDIVNFLSLCLRKDPSERPTAKGLLGHPFIEENDEQGSRVQFSEYYLQFKDNNN